jgi:hypothetical protein
MEGGSVEEVAFWTTPGVSAFPQTFLWFGQSDFWQSLPKHLGGEPVFPIKHLPGAVENFA